MVAPEQPTEALEGPAQEILDAAAKVITDRGLAETSISDIAERGGRLAGSDPLLLRVQGPPAVRRADPRQRPVLPADARGAAAHRFGPRTSSAAASSSRCRDCCPSSSASRSGPVDRDLGTRPARPRDGQGPRGAGPAVARAIADIIRHGQETGEFPATDDADELALRLGCTDRRARDPGDHERFGRHARPHAGGLHGGGGPGARLRARARPSIAGRAGDRFSRRADRPRA